ncbi:MAG: inosine/xanthosine triphosphatase [Patescibacteria group bacterium]|nr:inosine/xanthosine triphosphatase [Patescibacteria group bacterium]
MKTVVVASLNPVKIEAARLSFERVFPEQVFNFIGVAAQSGVADQPLSDKETRMGVNNRLHSAQLLSPEADYYIAFEGGVEDKEDGLEIFAWISIIDSSGKRGKARSASFILPNKIRELVIDQGLEMGDANDILFNLKNSKQKAGGIASLSKGLIARTDYYVHTGILALVPFMHSDLY